MPKLTDTHLVILSAAVQRQGGAVQPLPSSLKLQGGAATAILKSLIKRKLIATNISGSVVEIAPRSGSALITRAAG